MGRLHMTVTLNLRMIPKGGSRCAAGWRLLGGITEDGDIRGTTYPWWLLPPFAVWLPVDSVAPFESHSLFHYHAPFLNSYHSASLSLGIRRTPLLLGRSSLCRNKWVKALGLSVCVDKLLQALDLLVPARVFIDFEDGA